MVDILTFMRCICFGTYRDLSDIVVMIRPMQTSGLKSQPENGRGGDALVKVQTLVVLVLHFLMVCSGR